MTDGALLSKAVESRPPAATGSESLPLEIRILELFGAGSMTVGPTDVERRLGASKGVASPKLKTLAAAGYLIAVGNGQYLLGPAAAKLYIRFMACQLNQLDNVKKLVADVLGPVREVVIALTAIAPGAENAQCSMPNAQSPRPGSSIGHCELDIEHSSSEEPQA